MITFETIELGFDIATAISIIGAAVVFIYTTSRENKKQLQNEKVVEIWELLEEFRAKHFDGIYKAINSTAPSVGQLISKMSEFLRIEMLPTFAIFATKENIDELEKMRDETEIALDVWLDMIKSMKSLESIRYKNKDDEDKKIESDEYKDKKDIVMSKTDKGMRRYLNSMMRLDSQLTKNLRNQVHNESKNISKKIAGLYQKRKYTYREFKQI